MCKNIVFKGDGTYITAEKIINTLKSFGGFNSYNIRGIDDNFFYYINSSDIIMNSNNIPYGYNIKDIHKFNTNNKHLNTKEILYVRQITDDEYEKLINKKSNPDALKLLDYVENILTWSYIRNNNFDSFRIFYQKDIICSFEREGLYFEISKFNDFLNYIKYIG